MVVVLAWGNEKKRAVRRKKFGYNGEAVSIFLHLVLDPRRLEIMPAKHLSIFDLCIAAMN